MDNNEKIRLDLLVSQKAGVSRTMAVDLIKSGKVSLQGKPLKGPGDRLLFDTEITIQTPENIYVGRGGYKLEKALVEFDIDLIGKTCADIGASTGGFTQCMLNFGAARVYAIDSGSGQLADSLRTDSRVISMENTDARHLVLPEQVSFMSVDVSFISIKKILPTVLPWLLPGGVMVALIKPQFEAGPGAVTKKGIIINKKIHVKILKNMYNYFIENNLAMAGVTESPIKGKDGNTEYLACLQKK